jgi:hypothetical protein
MVYFNRRPHIMKIFVFFQKFQNLFFSKFSKLSDLAAFLLNFDLKIGSGKICIGKKVIHLSMFFPISGPLFHILKVPMALRKDFYSM